MKKDKVASNVPTIIIITPNSVNVDNPITFLISISNIAAAPANSIVIIPINNKILVLLELLKDRK